MAAQYVYSSRGTSFANISSTRAEASSQLQQGRARQGRAGQGSATKKRSVINMKHDSVRVRVRVLTEKKDQSAVLSRHVTASDNRREAAKCSME